VLQNRKTEPPSCIVLRFGRVYVLGTDGAASSDISGKVVEWLTKRPMSSNTKEEAPALTLPAAEVYGSEHL
jgi:hypothetical protein